ncbi:MAG: hypothetical protein JWR47_1733 [Phenylobacterium sp.]|uniref:COG4223 family protein n=1 Tax=Phenylobacterium sp. TaxID=1871053 RepID=UPI002623FB8F|nr:mitofilin family membrane protein [Phenylobacterium sp.]MDB5435476.1 hypothetical protein [Phenylobacterium sp.]MDB5496627.1 hypothetical protein [Phenylobacterium sp.]
MIPPADAPPTAAPKDPAAYRPRPVLGLTVWAMLAFGLLCILAGVAIADLGPRLFAAKSTSKAPAEAASPADPPAPASASAAPAPVTAPAAPTPDVERLSARVTTLESQQAHTSQAAAAALAVSAVVEASQGTGPFAEELESLRAISPPSPELQSLARLAQAGAPSRTALAASFPDYAARAASAARAPGDKAGLGDRIVYELSRIVTLRRVGDVPGDGVDALLARAERQVEDGDLDRALRTLDRLPPKAREAMALWRARAERRAEIDRNAQALRARALQALAAEARGAA